MPQIMVDVTTGAEVIAAPASKEQTTNAFCRMMRSWAAPHFQLPAQCTWEESWV